MKKTNQTRTAKKPLVQLTAADLKPISGGDGGNVFWKVELTRR
jgi:hypothetical protein